MALPTTAHTLPTSTTTFLALQRRPASLCKPHTTARARNALLAAAPLQISHLSTSPSPLRSSFFALPMLVKLHPRVSQWRKIQGQGGALASNCSLVLSTENLQWVFSVSAMVLMLLRNVAINKTLLVPLLALQAPRDVITWIRGEYGLWAAFLALLVRLFYYIPGELDLLLNLMLLIITSPYQVMDFRRTPASLVISAAIAIYLAFQHFSRAGGIKGAFREGAVIPSLAIICIACIPLAFLVQSF